MCKENSGIILQLQASTGSQQPYPKRDRQKLDSNSVRPQGWK